MARVVSLFLPTWSTDRLRRHTDDTALPHEGPLALVGRDGRRRVVVAVDAAAGDAGLAPGLPATDAQVLVPGLHIRPADPEGDAAALHRLALWLQRRYAPIVATDPPNGIVLDTTGADHLHGGEAAMLHDMVRRLAGFGLTARAAVADTWGAAHALARLRANPVHVAPTDAGIAPLAPLPLTALRLPPDMVEGLHALGFARIADLLAQPRAPLALRFGPQLGRRLDQMVGRISEPIEPVQPAERIETRRAFAEPIGAAETIGRAIGQLVAQLCAALAERGLGARCLDLVCQRVDDSAQAVRVGTATPVRDAKRLTRLLRERIERIDPGFGIETMSLVATIVEPFAETQADAGFAEAAQPDISDLIDTLTNRVGSQRIYRVAPVDSDVPERSVRHIAPLAPETGANWPEGWPRPVRLLTPPEPIQTVALLPDHPPVTFIWRGVRRRVRRADGPERVFGEWWKRDAELIAVRDYFRVEDDAGERFWIFRAGDGENTETGAHDWFLHGLFG